MKLLIEEFKLENNGKKYTLKNVQNDEELLELRKEHKEDYVLAKIGTNMYTTFVKIEGGTNFDGAKSICVDCAKFGYCPKVIDNEFINGNFTKHKYEALMRLEKYPFITLGVETYGRFFVWKCKEYTKQKKSSDSATNSNTNIIPSQNYYPYSNGTIVKK